MPGGRPMKPIEPRSAAVRGAACDEIADALNALWEQRQPNDEAMHQVRKDLKRARAALRLLREAVGEAAYARENTELRDAARPLAGVRDATVALGILRELLEKEKKPARRATLLEAAAQASRGAPACAPEADARRQAYRKGRKAIRRRAPELPPNRCTSRASR